MKPDLARYLDGAATPNSMTLAGTARWDNDTSPWSEPLKVLQECLGWAACGFPVIRRMLMHPAALRALLAHPTVRHVARWYDKDYDSQLPAPVDIVERCLRLPRGTIETAEEMGASVLILGESEAERYAIFNVIEAPA